MSSGSEEATYQHDVEEFLHADAEKLSQQFRDTFEKVSEKSKRPRVLIVGVAGAGKSSIINSVFGSDIAQEGVGRPITQHLEKYEPKEHPIILYDSKGLEVGISMDEVIRTTKEYFIDCNNGVEERCLENHIDLVWFIVNSAAARFQDVEEQLCQGLFKNIPIIFILNKADISTHGQRKALKKVINGMALQNCIGIHNAVTQKYCSKIPDFCRVCKSEDIAVYKKQQYYICDDCDCKYSTVRPTGLERIMKYSFKSLPSLVKEAFVVSQKISFSLKEEQAKSYITTFCNNETRNTNTSNGFSAHLTTMLTRLSMVWDFKEHAHLSATHMAQDVVHSFSLRDKVFLFIHKNKHQRLHATAIGIIWNRCVRELAKIILIESVEEIGERTEGDWHSRITNMFHYLTQDNIDLVEELLRKYTLKSVLDAEMPSVSTDVQPNHDTGCSWEDWLSIPHEETNIFDIKGDLKRKHKGTKKSASLRIKRKSPSHSFDISPDSVPVDTQKKRSSRKMKKRAMRRSSSSTDTTNTLQVPTATSKKATSTSKVKRGKKRRTTSKKQDLALVHSK